MMRIDVYLFSNGYARSRQRAKQLIESGNVLVDGKAVTKPSFEVDEGVEHNVTINDDCPYVSRGGLKLEAILNHTNYDISDKVCLDIGASTGGFTHCLLTRDAKKVYCVDSGTNQLDISLKNDERTVSYENYNARNLNIDDFSDEIDVITIDVSFISQTLILPAAIKLLSVNGVIFSLIKPQFEAGRENIGKGGIVKDKKAHFLSIKNVFECANLHGFKCNTLIKSPIHGGDGNTEYLAMFTGCGEHITDEKIKKIIHSI